MYTDKVIFKGKPIEFIAVALEFLKDLHATGQDYSSMVEPSRDKVERRGTPYVIPVPDLSADVPLTSIRIVLLRKDLGQDIRYEVTALRRPTNDAQLTLRVDDDQMLDLVIDSWANLLGYMENQGWLDSPYAKVAPPESWVAMLQEMAFERGSDDWWKEIEKLTKQYWVVYSRAALPITSKSRNKLTLEGITGYTRQHIARKTTLSESEKDVT